MKLLKCSAFFGQFIFSHKRTELKNGNSFYAKPVMIILPSKVFLNSLLSKLNLKIILNCNVSTFSSSSETNFWVLIFLLAYMLNMEE